MFPGLLISHIQITIVVLLEPACGSWTGKEG
jgi:hypothetical protein